MTINSMSVNSARVALELLGGRRADAESAPKQEAATEPVSFKPKLVASAEVDVRIRQQVEAAEKAAEDAQPLPAYQRINLEAQLFNIEDRERALNTMRVQMVGERECLRLYDETGVFHRTNKFSQPEPYSPPGGWDPDVLKELVASWKEGFQRAELRMPEMEASVRQMRAEFTANNPKFFAGGATAAADRAATFGVAATKPILYPG
ncbi:hypothetical protein BKE38_05270 [Pseudoroseomonas deserti]|uniref:Uncharacterized protein n=1 Tax=Teichococcus deserti TaxID=1817963 RepID=A0A1V2H5T1_9PROT|nr:hypothetical protein [Pseudoroseomonas deserti]ONG56864.1 hypothetical protein BKE38_05270 [Pseudoroseomonas deserti]